MARRVKTAILVMIVFVGLWALYHRQDIETPADLIQLAQDDLSRLPIPYLEDIPATVGTLASVDQRVPDTIRIASFRLNRQTGAAQELDAARLMVEICRRFDLVAFQDVADRNPKWGAQLVSQLKSATGRDYRFLASRYVEGSQFLILFDAAKLESPAPAYSVNDPDNLFERDPFVCWFRTRIQNQPQAFTFSLVSILSAPEYNEREIEHLGNLYRAIRADGRREDDIVLVGDFATGGHTLDRFHAATGLQSVFTQAITNTLQTRESANMLYSPVATIEMSGSNGVFDFMRHFNLYLEDALKISEHLPIWADLSIREGIPAEQVAAHQNRD